MRKFHGWIVEGLCLAAYFFLLPIPAKAQDYPYDYGYPQPNPYRQAWQPARQPEYHPQVRLPELQHMPQGLTVNGQSMRQPDFTHYHYHFGCGQYQPQQQCRPTYYCQPYYYCQPQCQGFYW